MYRVFFSTFFITCLACLSSCFKNSSQIAKKQDNAESRDLVEKVNLTYYYLVGREYAAKGKVDLAIQALHKIIALDPDSSQVKFELSKLYLKKGDLKAGVALLDEIVEDKTDHREAILMLANLYSASSKVDRARELYERILKSNPRDHEAMIYLVLLEADNQQSLKAKSRLDEYLKKNRDFALGYYYRAKIFQRMGRDTKAIRDYKKAMKLKFPFVQAGEALAELYFDLNQKDKSLKMYEWLIKQSKNFAYFQRLIQFYILEKKYVKAKQVMENYQSLDPGNIVNLLKLGILCIELKDYQKAISIFSKLKKKNEGGDNVDFYLGIAYESINKNEEAAEVYEGIPEQSELFLESVHRRAFLFAKLKKNQEAIASVKSALKRKSLSPDQKNEIMLIAARLYDHLKEREKAKKLLDAILDLYPDNQKALYLKASVIEKLGQWQESIVLMQRILELDPKHVGALNFIAYTWADNNLRLSEAEASVRKALSFESEDPYIIDTLGWVLYKRGLYKQALVELLKAFKLKPEESVIANHIGDVYVRKGAFLKAREYYKKALDLGPENDDEKSTLQQKISKLPAGNQCPQQLRSCIERVFESRTPGSFTP